MSRDIVECLITNGKDEFLLQKKTFDYPLNPGGWCLFGGEIEKNESPKHAVKREMNEELGENLVKKYVFLKEINYEGRLMTKGKVFLFHGKFQRKIEDISLKEGAGFAFFEYSETKKLELPKWEQEAIYWYFALQQSLK